MVFEEKLHIFQDESSDILCEIFSEGLHRIWEMAI
jgi:hypothetical protein